MEDALRVAPVLDTLIEDWRAPGAEPAGPAGPLLDAIRSELEDAAAVALGLLDGSVELPLRLNKGRLTQLDRCERSALAAFAPVPEDRGADTVGDRARFRGSALDRYVLHQLQAGPVADPLEDLRSLLVAQGEDDLLEYLDAEEAADRRSLEELLSPLAASSSAWAGLHVAWWARTQSRATVSLADGAVVCSGVVDVELGGPGTGLPSVVVEVKTGGASLGHLHELVLYALLVALRDRAVPGAMLRWAPGTAPAVFRCGEGELRSAARRLGDGIVVWAELLAGRAPGEQPGAWCRWCADADRCPSFAPPAAVDLSDPDGAFEVEGEGEGVAVPGSHGAGA